MDAFRFYCAVLIVFGLNFTNGQNCSDGSYTTINDPTRSTAVDVGDLATCDSGNIDEKTWYRFNSYTGTSIPERAENDYVQPLRCGTDFPIFIQGIGSHPRIVTTMTTASVCATALSGSSCHAGSQMQIEIYRCPSQGSKHSFYLYKLKNPASCPMAYCAGELPDCSGSEMWNGFNCVDYLPQMLGPPIFTGPNTTGNGVNTQIYFKCTVQYNKPASDGNARFSVTFLFDGQEMQFLGGVYKTLNSFVLNAGESMTVILNEDLLKGRLGHEISCQASAYWGGDIGNKGTTQFSNYNFFVGIQSDSKNYIVDLVNGTNYQITFTSTVPLTCAFCAPIGQNCKCQYIFRLKSEAAARCAMFWKVGTSWSVSVYIVPPSVATSLYFQLAFNPYNEDKVYGSTALWHGYIVPPAKITAPAVQNRYLWCLSHGDPHIVTFDGDYFLNSLEGDFNLVYARNDKQHLEIQVRHAACSRSVTCICGVIAREGNSAVKVFSCGRGSPTVVWLLRQNPPDASAIFRDRTGFKFSIRMPSGLRVEVDATTSLSYTVMVYLPDQYHSLTSRYSMCGNSNRVKGDDGLPNQADFRVAAVNDYFMKQPPCSTVFNPAAVNCDCYNTTVFKCSNVDPGAQTSPSKTPIGNGLTSGVVCNMSDTQSRARRSVSENDNILDPEDLYPPYTYDPTFGENVTLTWPTLKGKTEAQVEAYCQTGLSHSPVYDECVDNINVRMILSSCTADVQILDEWLDLTSYVNLFQQNCMYFMVSTNSDSFDENGTLSDSFNSVFAEVCSNQCSGHGSCANSSCTCDTGFMGADCSIDRNKPPTLSSIMRQGICDVQERACSSVTIFGAGVADISTLKCRFTDQLTSVDAYSSGTFVTAGQVACPVPETPTHRRRRSPEGAQVISTLAVSVANDGTSFSNQLTYVVYDSSISTLAVSDANDGTTFSNQITSVAEDSSKDPQPDYTDDPQSPPETGFGVRSAGILNRWLMAFVASIMSFLNSKRVLNLN